MRTWRTFFFSSIADKRNDLNPLVLGSILEMIVIFCSQAYCDNECNNNIIVFLLLKHWNAKKKGPFSQLVELPT